MIIKKNSLIFVARCRGRGGLLRHGCRARRQAAQQATPAAAAGQPEAGKEVQGLQVLVVLFFNIIEKNRKKNQHSYLFSRYSSGEEL